MTRILLLIAALCVAFPASATFWEDEFAKPKKRMVKKVRPKPTPRRHFTPPVKRDLTPGPLTIEQQCHPVFRSVGDRANSDGGATSAAWKAWEQQAIWTYGRRYGDRTNARDVTIECVKAEPGDLIGEWFRACEVRARPCMAPQKGPEK